MLKNILKTPKFPCSKCGSENTILSKKPVSSLNKIEKILNAYRVTVRSPFLGQVYVCCEDCKHEALLNVL